MGTTLSTLPAAARRGALYLVIVRCVASLIRNGRTSLLSRLSSLATLSTIAATYSLGSSGLPGQGPFRFLLGMGPKKYRIVGTVAPGWEPVREAFKRNFELGLERGAQCCVYHKGVKVVDLAGALEELPGYDQESLQVVFSCSKFLASLSMVKAEDLGLIRLDAPISSFWPTFSDEEPSKAKLTTVDVLRHEAGMTCFNHGTAGGGSAAIRTAFDAVDTDGSGDLDAVEFQKALEAASPGIDAKRAADIFAAVDSDGNGRIDFKEFESAVMAAAGTSNPLRSFGGGSGGGGGLRRIRPRDLKSLRGLRRCDPRLGNSISEMVEGSCADFPTRSFGGVRKSKVALAALGKSSPSSSSSSFISSSVLRNASRSKAEKRERRSNMGEQRKEGTRRAYHGVTRGLILNETLRRAVAAGGRGGEEERTIGSILRHHLCRALGSECSRNVFLGEEIFTEAAKRREEGRGGAERRREKTKMSKEEIEEEEIISTAATRVQRLSGPPPLPIALSQLFVSAFVGRGAGFEVEERVPEITMLHLHRIIASPLVPKPVSSYESRFMLSVAEGETEGGRERETGAGETAAAAAAAAETYSGKGAKEREAGEDKEEQGLAAVVTQALEAGEKSSLVDSEWFLEIESPSTNALANARGLARLAAACAEGGELDGKRVFSERAIGRLMAEPKLAFDAAMLHDTAFTEGGLCKFGNPDEKGFRGGGGFERSWSPPPSHRWPEDSEGFYGWGGIGGSAVAFNPTSRLAVSYTECELHCFAWATMGWDGVRFNRILPAIVKCSKAAAMAMESKL